MFNRRDFLLGSAAAVAMSLLSPPLRKPRLPPLRSGFLDRPGCRIYYEVTGSGPAIIFAHGIGNNHLTWWQQVPHFCGRYTCVTFGHRGYLPGSEIPAGPDPRDFAGSCATDHSKEFHFHSFPMTAKQPNGLRYRRLGRKKLENGKPPSFRTSSKNAQSPSRPVHPVMTAGRHFF